MGSIPSDPAMEGRCYGSIAGSYPDGTEFNSPAFHFHVPFVYWLVPRFFRPEKADRYRHGMLRDCNLSSRMAAFQAARPSASPGSRTV